MDRKYSPPIFTANTWCITHSNYRNLSHTTCSVSVRVKLAPTYLRSVNTSTTNVCIYLHYYIHSLIHGAYVHPKVGCFWNMPANYDAGVFERCLGDSGEVRMPPLE
jgi:hypothetical protein